MSDAEMEQVLRGWNKTRADYRRSGCVHEMIEKQAEVRAEAVAMVFKGEQITYRELNAKANRLARFLRKRGVGPEKKVLIRMERSIEMLVAVLGTLKAGGGCVPVDADCPTEIYRYMAAEAVIIVAHEKTADRVGGDGEKVVVMDRQWEEIAAEVEENLAGGADGENIAYVIYTLDSTGMALATGISHNSIVRMVENSSFLKLEAHDRIAQTASLSNDLAIVEIFSALICGASLVLIDKIPFLVPQEFSTQIREQKVSALFIASEVFDYLACETPRVYESLTRLIITGEIPDAKYVMEIQTKIAPGQLINVYGPVECTGIATWNVIDDALEEGTIIPIGRPISNTSAYILDENMNPVPVGVVGQLYIGGDGLTRGYLNSPEMTSDKFVPDPFSYVPGRRLYKTGDLGCYLPDARIRCLGRIDSRIKVNGLIVEPEGIEVLLSQHPLVRQAAIASKVGISGNKRLIAYLIASDESAPTPSELRKYLKERVPDYMIPANFQFMKEMPLTPGGKIDRKRLPAPDTSRPELTQEYVAPRTPVEKVLSRIWSEIFGIEKIGINDNFFQLGGHSLLATQANFRVGDALMVDIYLCDIFAAPTIAKLANKLLQDPGQRQRIERIAEILLSLDQYSDEEVEKMIDTKKAMREDALE